jgi:uncharacterized membrane protein
VGGNKINGKKEHDLLFFLLSHHSRRKLHRTIQVAFRGKRMYLCARCTGICSGILSTIALRFLGFAVPHFLYVPLISALPAPATLDWMTQSCGLRESKNAIRITTGYLLGAAEGLALLLLASGMLQLFLMVLAVVGVYFLMIYVVALKTRFLDSYLRENFGQ